MLDPYSYLILSYRKLCIAPTVYLIVTYFRELLVPRKLRARNFVTCVKTFICMFPSRERGLIFEISVQGTSFFLII